MPTKTPHFGLEAHVSGDYYSSAVDKRRMTAIDSHMAFVSDAIGAGVIDGWEVTWPDESEIAISVSAGMGLIDRHVTRTFGVFSKVLEDNNLVYLWMRRRAGTIGQFSPFASMISYTYSDVIAPSSPTGVAEAATTISTALIQWDANLSDFDFAYYNVYRSLNGSVYEIIGTATDAEYLDSGLEDDTVYYYKVTAVDFTGNESTASSPISIQTDADTAPPADPSGVELINSLEAIHLIWKPSPIGSVERYTATVTPVNEEGDAQGNAEEFSTEPAKPFLTISSLINGQRYQIIVRAIGTNGVASEGVVVHGRPDLFDGPYDVVDITLSDRAGNGIVSNVILTVEWDPISDPYVSDTAIAYEIQLRESNLAGGVITSEWIKVPEGFSRDIVIYPHKDGNGQIVSRSITARTQYFVTVRAIDEDGIRSIGKPAVYTTRSFDKPRAPTQISIDQREDRSLAVTWTNSISIFVNNVLSFEKIDSENPSLSETVLDQSEIADAQSYIVPSSSVEAGKDYVFTLFARDEFGNESDPIESTFTIPGLSDLVRPPAPSQVLGVAGNTTVMLTWNRPAIEFVNGFRIYRAEETGTYTASDFQRLETVDGSTFGYADYEVSNDQTYVYFVTTVDIFGRESRNPIDDDFFDYKLTVMTPQSAGDLTSPADFAVVIDGDGTGLNLTWSVTAGQYDGYEIFRSKDNKHSFERVAIAEAVDVSYHDAKVLTETATFYYLIRKFRGEADLFVTESEATVAAALFLGTVETSDGVVTIDQSEARVIRDLEDPVRERSQEVIIPHRHEFVTALDDRRINLGNAITVSDWTTSDFQTYTTTVDISDATISTVYLNGENVGTFAILYNLNQDTGVLTFERRLAKGDLLANANATFPFESPPSISVVLDNLAETSEIVPTERMEPLSSQQVSVGLVLGSQVPERPHDGRRKERLQPVQIATIAVDDGYRYAPVSKTEIIGAGITWYDMIFAEEQDGDVLVGSNSDGIYVSTDFGLVWEKKFTPITPVCKMFYSPSADFYFAATNRGMLGSGGGSAGGFSVWEEIRGMENTKAIRSIVEDANSIVYCSSDLGVFKLQRDVGLGVFFWDQTQIFGPRSTESYAMLYDSPRDRVIVSNELGIFETTNGGDLWSFSDEFPDQRPIFDFWLNGTTIYAITNFIVWRRRQGEDMFPRLATLDGVSKCRKIIFWKNRLLVTTDIGLMVSIPGDDPEDDDAVDFELAYPQLNRGAMTPPVTSFNLIDDKLFVGTEERLYVSAAVGKMSLQNETVLGVLPTVFVDGVEQKIGFRYTTSSQDLRKFVCFDEKQSVDAVVTIANQYKIYKAPEGGWADANFAAGVYMHVNGVRTNEFSLAERPAVALAQMALPSYNDRNAHKAGADIAKDQVSSSLMKLLAVSSQTDPVLTGFNKENVVSSLFSVERLVSQIYPESRVVPQVDDNGAQVLDDNGIAKVKPFRVPPFRVLLMSLSKKFAQEGLVSFGVYKDLYGTSTSIGTFGSELNGIGIPGGSDAQAPAGDGAAGGGGGDDTGDTDESTGGDDTLGGFGGGFFGGTGG